MQPYRNFNGNGHIGRGAFTPAGGGTGNIPILGQPSASAAAKRWRCVKGHEYIGEPPKMVLPLNPLAQVPPGTPMKMVMQDRVCLLCVLEHLGALFPVSEVTDGEDAPAAPNQEQEQE